MRKKELEVVDGVLDTAEEAVKVILKEGPAAAMNRFNRKPDEEERLATDLHGFSRIKFTRTWSLRFRLIREIREDQWPKNLEMTNESYL